MNYTMKDLIQIFEEAIEEEAHCIVVELKIEGCEDSEYIINSYVNFKNKLNYYKNTYNENLEHKFDAKVKIVNISYHFSLNDMVEYIS